MPLRIYLTGRVDVERDGSLLDTRRFPGRQGRRAFAYLVCERAHPVPRDELAEAVWPEGTPPAWDAAISALASKLRSLLSQLGLHGPSALSGAFGCYQLRLPHDAWVDLEAAAAAIDEAEGVLRGGAPGRAWGPASVAAVIARRPFLPGEEGAWLEQRRARLRAILVRALDCLSEVELSRGDGVLAVQFAAETVALEPFRETGYQRLMRAHAALGNRAEALRVYERCRTLLVAELGTDPSPETEVVYLDLLRSC